MTAGMDRPRRVVRPQVLSVLAAAVSWTALLAAGAQPAVADVRSKQWYLAAMQAEEMWKVSTGEGVKVAVIDTGVNPHTTSLKGQVLKGFDATGVSGDENDDYNGHGTNMAELIAGTGAGGGIKGLAPGAKIIPVRVGDADFSERHGIEPGHSDAAIKAAADSDARIISMSMSSKFPAKQQRAMAEYAHDKGKIFFASVGNTARELNTLQYPAAYPEVVGVASADRNGEVAEYSQNGGGVDIAAPGQEMTLWCDNTFESYCLREEGGTSSATAIASASAALIWSIHPDWTANQVLNVLFDTAARDWKNGDRSAFLGHGLIRPSMNVLKGKGDPGDPDISPLTKKRNGAAPAVPSAPVPSTSAHQQPAREENEEGDGALVAGESGKSGSGPQVGLALGVAAAAAVLGGIAYTVVRRRRAA
ncbi:MULTISPECIES: S8 family serine peptidase [unclassified Streptomyces]|uniref:S8 family serine peptidase n=1 Tax=unclassified Streptomyces TaxID=2593676 RepID=UPI0006AF81FD|nr:S8 family serine peptidase [Streptomyces sp. NRRL F-2295]KOU03294.1 serine protease [Streptomyces sp. NRRL F-2295]